MRPLSRSIRCQRTVHVQVAVTVTGDWYFLRRRHCRPDRRWSGPTRRAAASHRSSGPIFEGWSRHRKQLKRIRACPASSVTATRNELHWFPSIVSGTPPSPSLLTLATAPAAAAVTVAVMTPTATVTFDLCIHNIITYMTAVTCLRLSMSTNQVIASSYSSCFKTVAVEAAVGLPIAQSYDDDDDAAADDDKKLRLETAICYTKTSSKILTSLSRISRFIKCYTQILHVCLSLD